MNYRSTPRLLQYLLILVLVVLVVSCEKEAVEEPEIDPCNPEGVPGELLEATYFMSFTPEQVQSYLSAFGAPIGLQVDYTVDIYQVAYQTLDKAGSLTNVSGAMFIPRGLDTLDLLSVQHGTIFKRDQVGSVNPLFALDGMITAMNGYLVVVPDYLGLGDSQVLHPYLHAELSANAVIDMIRAARIYACQNEVALTERLFLAGYSEGGYVTLVSQMIMETEYAEEFQLTAVAPMAGPHDLVGSTRNLLKRESYANPAYLVYLVGAYNDIYEWDQLADIFQEPYATNIPDLLDGSLNASEINARLTTDLDSLFKPEFRTSFLAGQEELIEGALRENSPLDWGPIAPVRLIHGTADSTVFYENSVTVYQSMISNGGLSVDLIPLFGADHGTAAFPAYYFAIQWFDSLRTSSQVF